MAKKNSSNEISELGKALSKEMKKAFTTKALQEIGDKLVDVVKNRIIDGYGVEENGGKKKKFKKLKKSTIKARERKKLSSKTKPATSNQVETGTFVEGIYAEAGDDGSITLQPPSDREDMAAAQELNGRPSLYLTDKEEEMFEDMVDEIIDDVLAKILK